MIVLPLLLLVTLLAAVIGLAARSRSVMEFVNLGASVLTLILSVMLAALVRQSGPVSVWDGILYADALSALVVLLVSFVYVACAVYAIGYFRHDEKHGDFNHESGAAAPLGKLRKYYSLTPLFVCFMLLMALANNLGIMWVAIEGTTLASVFLVTFYGRATSLEAAWKYAIIGGVGLSMGLLGTILTYYSASLVMGTETIGGLNWSVLVTKAAHFDKTTMRLAFIFILMGYGTKAGIAPMHTWKPDVYSEAPVPVAAMLATALLNCAMYGLLRFFILTSRCLGPEFASHLLIIFGLLSMGIAVPFILVQRSFRRLLAYSSIDHGGIMILGLAFGGPLGALGMLLHMTFHTVTKPLLFFSAGNVQQHLKTDQFRRAKGGLIHAMPITGTLFLMTTLAVVGSPPFSLFQSEFTILRAGFDGGHYVPAVLFIIFLVMIFTGFLVHIARLVLGPDPGTPRAKTCVWKKYSLIGLGGIIVVLGFWLPSPLYDLVQSAARIVRGGQ